MPESTKVAAGHLAPSQAAELARLVDLEACWENLRKGPLPGPVATSLTQELKARQRAYDAFHDLLVAYNRRYAPAHVPELLLNTPVRLAAWCRTMRDLYRQAEQSPQGHCPVHLLEKAHRWAEGISARLHKAPLSRPVPPATIRAAIDDLGALVQWCDEMAGVAATG
jgi:hypothetical protein